MPDQIEIDIRTRVWSSNERIFVLFPGRGHRFYETFLIRSCVYLDVPGLELQTGTVPGKHKDFAARLKLSDEIRIWHDKGCPVDKDPIRDLSRYADAKIGRRRALLASQVQTLYGEIEPGDLIIVPGPNYFSDTLIGRVKNSPLPLHYQTSQEYPGERILVRAVEWEARIPKWRFTPELIRRLQTPNPLTLLEKSLWSEILRVAFDNYIFNDVSNARFETQKRKFTRLVSSNIELLMNLSAAIEAATEVSISDGTEQSDKLDASIDLLDEFIFYAPELVVNINSPGDLSAFSKRLAPLVVATLIALALSPYSEAQAADFHVTNSLPAHENCAVKVDQIAKDTINTMGYERWQKLCHRLKRTQERTGLKTHVRVTAPFPPSHGA